MPNIRHTIWVVCRYSPLHTLDHVKSLSREYPATLLLTGDHDDRVVPLHSLKFIAQLQHCLGASHQQVSTVILPARITPTTHVTNPYPRLAPYFSDIVVERWSLTSELSLSCARPTADG